MGIDDLWAEMKALYKAHQHALIAVIGLLVFLPILAVLLFIPLPQVAGSAQAIANALNKWISEHWLALSLQMLITSFGAAVAYRIMLAREPETVSQALARATPVLPLLVAMNFLGNLIIMFGLRLFILPGLYFAGRLMFVNPAIVASDGKQPLSAIGQALKLSGGHVVRLVAMAIFLFILLFIAALVATIMLGTLAQMIAPEAGFLVTALIQSGWIAILTLGGLLLATAGWRLANAAQPLAR